MNGFEEKSRNQSYVHVVNHLTGINQKIMSEPTKDQIRARTREAIKSGKLTRQPCEKCGTTERIHAHHVDYSDHLKVMWLCPKHHKQWHKEHGYADGEPGRVAIPVFRDTRDKMLARISKLQENGERISYDTFINQLLANHPHT